MIISRHVADQSFGLLYGVDAPFLNLPAMRLAQRLRKIPALSRASFVSIGSDAT
jgi:hypothetical protein